VHSDSTGQLNDLEARFDLLEKEQAAGDGRLYEIAQQTQMVAMQDANGLDSKIREVISEHVSRQEFQLQEILARFEQRQEGQTSSLNDLDDLDTKIRRITQDCLISQLRVLEARFDSLEQRPLQGLDSLENQMRDVAREQFNQLDARIEGIHRIVAPRLDAVDARMERLETLTAELENLRTVPHTGFLDQVPNGAGGGPVAEVSQLASSAILLGQQVETKISLQTEALERLSARVDCLAEVGESANEAIRVGHRIESMFSDHNRSLQEKTELLAKLETRVNTLEGPLQESLQAIQQNAQALHSDNELRQVLESHITTAHSKLQVLTERVDALGEVGQHAVNLRNEAMKLGTELQQAILGQDRRSTMSSQGDAEKGRALSVFTQEELYGASDPSTSQKGELGSSGHSAGLPMGRNSNLTYEEGVTPAANFSMEWFKANSEMIVEVDRVTRETKGTVQRLDEELLVQREALEAHKASMSQKFNLLDALHANAQTRCAQVFEAAEKLIISNASPEKGAAAESYALAQHLLHTLVSDLRSDAQSAESARKRDLNNVMDSLREELDTTRMVGIADTTRMVGSAQTHMEDDALSPSRGGRLSSRTSSPILTARSVLKPVSILRTSATPIRERPASVLRTHSAPPMRERPVAQWPQVAAAADRREPSPVRYAQALPSRHTASPRTVARRVLLAPSASSNAVTTFQTQTATVMTSRAAPSSGSTHHYCIKCGNPCMDDATMCRRCTLNSQRMKEQQASATGANTLMQPPAVWTTRVLRTSSPSPAAATDLPNSTVSSVSKIVVCASELAMASPQR
jgi:ribosomal protein L40E